MRIVLTTRSVRKVAARALATWACACAFGCAGGTGTAEGPKSVDLRTGDSGASAAPPTSTAPATTTVDLPNASTPGTRLPDATPTPSASPSSDAGAPRNGGHAHEVGRTPTDIRALVVAHRDEARACYDKALPDHPGIEGDLVVQWTIDPKGHVTQVSLDTVHSKIVEPGVADCIGKVIQGISFAASPGGYETTATYPFNFHPHHGQKPAVAPAP